MIRQDDEIATAEPMSEDARVDFQALVGLMIPASLEYDIPGADDPGIFERIVVASEPDRSLVDEGLRALDDLSHALYGERFAMLDEDDKVATAERFAQTRVPHVSGIVRVTAQCYYSDERVMAALGMENRAPFPMGYTVEQGDWSLLDPVKKRTKFYRKA
ncbi:MAG: hypothetical protein P8Q36_07150 [Alphaproteobacteria bacterium]|jgi:hypothetical protein|nr:hypothetical protein [Rhodospirillaceae bacterium]MBT7614416.1 hypothetical protein [Rhodospirillaceae bacterium]MBT7645601.1 hypothetical protein [Rhodospirillaceae bacterium]MDG2480631.1 hypothetical protein [Alphaproteobacteria bacterium]